MKPSGASMEAGGSSTILLVEDNLLLRIYYADALSAAGFVVLEADEPEAALRHAADASHLHAVVTDIGLPGDIDGKELAAKVSDLHPEARVVLISGDPDRGGDTRYTFLGKPFTTVELEAALR